MKATTTPLEGLIIIEPQVFGDSRGYFFESYNKRKFHEVTGLDINFVQDNESMSQFGVIRGLHFQRAPHSQSKLVRCVEGCVRDVIVDIRQGSPTFGKHFAIELSDKNKKQIFIPKGFAHGFSVQSETARLQYKCDSFYAPESEGGINPFDEALGIDWGIPASKIIMSGKDKLWKRLSETADLVF